MKAADWSTIFKGIRNSACCVILCGTNRDTTQEDNLMDELKSNTDKMRSLGIFLPTETVEAAEMPADASLFLGIVADTPVHLKLHTKKN